MSINSDYEVKLEIFQGPLDLLLHLIRKNEVDIFDIPISTITDQYLEYIDIMKFLNVNIAGDFFVMASTLIHIKSRMLLPEILDGDEDEEDPRLEITRPLLEYLRLKEVAGELTERELLNRDVFTRRLEDNFMDRLNSEGPLLDVNLFQLIDAFKRVVGQKLPGAQLSFRIEEWSLKDKTAFIMERLKNHPMYFTELFKDDGTVGELVVTFLALLELVHRGLVRLYQNGPDKDIRLEGIFMEKEEAFGE